MKRIFIKMGVPQEKHPLELMDFRNINT